MNKQLKAYIYLALAMGIAGSAVVANKMMVGTIPIFLVTELGIVIGLIILIFITFIIKKEHYVLDRRSYGILFLQAIFGIFLYRIFTLAGLTYTTAANSGLITSVSPGIVVILAYIILKEKISHRGIVGLCLVMTGLFFINLYTYLQRGSGGNSILGNSLIMVAVICEALFSVLSKLKCTKMSALYRTTIIVSFSAICLLPFAIKDAIGYDFGSLPIKTAGCIIYYGICVSFLSYVFWFKGIALVKANEAAPFTSIVPVSSIILAALVLKEKITLIHIAGMIFIISGIIISSKQEQLKDLSKNS